MFDIIILILLIIASVAGFRDGLLKQIASWVGFVVGLVVACNYAGTLGEKTGFGVFVGFIILCVAVPIAFSWGASLITKVLDWTPFVGTVNRLGGVALSVVKWALLLSFITYYGSKVVAVPESLQNDSFAYGFLSTFGMAFWNALN